MALYIDHSFIKKSPRNGDGESLLFILRLSMSFYHLDRGSGGLY